MIASMPVSLTVPLVGVLPALFLAGPAPAAAARLPTGTAQLPADAAQTLTWTDLWSALSQRTTPVEPATVATLWPALVILAMYLAWPPAHRWGRTLVTVVHEAGHAAVGILVGRRFRGFVVAKDLSGHAVTSGKPRGLGRVLTTWAGYPAPAFLGAALVAVALRGWSGAVLATGLLVLLVLLVMSRSLRTVGVVLVVVAVTGGLWWLGGLWRAGAVVGVGLVLLLGAWGSLGDVARSANRHQDHGTLARLTYVPAWLWLVSWFLADGVATAWVGWLAWGLVV
ncbi:M50 family metallopeptidase [Actinomyces faecalis]|uniref:M50 family metallopeptidase n=1 Tax=Actinomyces faecalis TaxID=2722820 RepID=UPI002E2C1BF8|nr:M50 family metallopeptidase [Actinomyces faecalis]